MTEAVGTSVQRRRSVTYDEVGNVKTATTAALGQVPALNWRVSHRSRRGNCSRGLAMLRLECEGRGLELEVLGEAVA